MTMILRNNRGPHFSLRKLLKDLRVNLTLSTLGMGLLLGGGYAIKNFWIQKTAKNSTDTKMRNFALYSTSPTKAHASPWKFTYSYRRQSWIYGDGQKQKSPQTFSFKGLYARKNFDAPPRYFRYWISELPSSLRRKLKTNVKTQQDFQSHTIYMSNLPQEVLQKRNYPTENIIAVTFQRFHDQLNLKISSLTSATPWEVLSWSIQSGKAHELKSQGEDKILLTNFSPAESQRRYISSKE